MRTGADSCTFPRMSISPLTAMRLAAPGEPSLREIARRCKLSASAVSLFELGKSPLGPAAMRRYAKAIKRPLSDVQNRSLRAQLRFHQDRALELRALLHARGVAKLPKGRPPVRRTA